MIDRHHPIVSPTKPDRKANVIWRLNSPPIRAASPSASPDHQPALTSGMTCCRLHRGIRRRRTSSSRKVRVHETVSPICMFVRA
jgi:hypothetical protein